MKKMERDKLLGAYLKNKEYDSSSSFVVDYFKFDGTENSNHYLAYLVESCLKQFDNSYENLLKFRHIVSGLSLATTKLLYESYTSLMTEFCDNYEMYKRFKLDEEDEEGWKIYKELSSKTHILSDALQFMKYRNV